jgi:Protein of unknown function (DUF2846)
LTRFFDLIERRIVMAKARRLMLGSVAAILGCATFLGCATAPMPASSPPAEAAADAAAKTFVPADGKSSLYVMRTKDSFGQVEPYMIEVDGKMIGYLAPGMFFLVSVDPGKHEITVASNGGLDRSGVNSAAGKNYYYQVSKASPPPNSISSSPSSSFSAPPEKPSIGIMLFEGLAKNQIRGAKLAQGSAP